MRILPNAAPAAASTSRPAFALSPASVRTPAFRALFPQLRLLGRLLKDLRPQTPRWPMPAPSRQDEGIRADRFSPPTGRGVPIRISVAEPAPRPGPLKLKPWRGSLLKPWCGTRLKPWLNLPHIFRRLLDHACRVRCDSGGHGKGVPIRIN